MKRIILFLAALCLVGSPVWALPTGNNIITAQTPSRGMIQFLNADTANTTFKTLYTAGSNGSKCNALWFDTNDPATHIVTCQIVNGGLKQGGFFATTAAATATSFTQISLMPPAATVSADSDGNPFFEMNSGDTLQCNFQTTVTSPDQLDGHSNCSDF